MKFPIHNVGFAGAKLLAQFTQANHTSSLGKFPAHIPVGETVKYATRLADTVHLLAAIQILREVAERTGREPRHLLSSAAMAKSLHTNPAYVRKLMGIAARGGLMLSEKGKANARLSRAATEISLLDIYRAVEGEKKLLKLDIHTNPECHTGKAIQFAIGGAYDEVQKAAEAAMANITLQTIIDTYYESEGQDSLPD